LFFSRVKLLLMLQTTRRAKFFFDLGPRQRKNVEVCANGKAPGPIVLSRFHSREQKR
jgi:hypothetical protein